MEGVEADVSTGLLESVDQLGTGVGGVGGVAACSDVTAGGVKRRFTGAVTCVDVTFDTYVNVVA